MSIKPIIMQAESVRAILAGRKTQFREVVKPGKLWPDGVQVLGVSEIAPGYFQVRSYEGEAWEIGGDAPAEGHSGIVMGMPSPYRPGDILYIKETWAMHTASEGRIYSPGDGHAWGSPIYKATFRGGLNPKCEGFTAWRSPLHMPRWAARLWLKVTDVRVERLQDITEAEASAEGVQPEGVDIGGDCASPIIAPSHKLAYETVWNQINAKRGYPWESNPWVFVYTFETTSQPEHTKETR